MVNVPGDYPLNPSFFFLSHRPPLPSSSLLYGIFEERKFRILNPPMTHLHELVFSPPCQRGPFLHPTGGLPPLPEWSLARFLGKGGISLTSADSLFAVSIVLGDISGLAQY